MSDATILDLANGLFNLAQIMFLAWINLQLLKQRNNDNYDRRRRRPPGSPYLGPERRNE